jgi:DNA-binding beta-propeller fold protein YncE
MAAHVFAHVTNSLDGTVSVIDPALQSVVNTIQVPALQIAAPEPGPNPPAGIAIAEDGGYAYVLGSTSTFSLVGPSAVSAIDTAQQQVAWTINFPATLNPTVYYYFVSVSRDGRYLYVLAQIPHPTGNQTPEVVITCIDTTSRNSIWIKTIANMPNIAGCMDISRDGRYLYFMWSSNIDDYNSGIVSVFDTARRDIVHNIPIKSIPFGIAMAPNDRYGYAYSIIGQATTPGGGLPTVSVFRTSTPEHWLPEVIWTIPVPPPAEDFFNAPLPGIVISPDEKYAYVLVPDGISAIDIPAKQVIWSVASEAAGCIALTPDGKFLYVSTSPFGPSPSLVTIIDVALRQCLGDRLCIRPVTTGVDVERSFQIALLCPVVGQIHVIHPEDGNGVVAPEAVGGVRMLC